MISSKIAGVCYNGMSVMLPFCDPIGRTSPGQSLSRLLNIAQPGHSHGLNRRYGFGLHGLDALYSVRSESIEEDPPLHGHDTCFALLKCALGDCIEPWV